MEARFSAAVALSFFILVFTFPVPSTRAASLVAMAAADQGDIQSGPKTIVWEAAKNGAKRVGEAIKYFYRLRRGLRNPQYCAESG